MMMMMMMNTEEEEEEVIPVCWSDLPFDLVAQIADKVMSFSLSDYIRFGSVCYPWRSFLLQDYYYYYEHIKLSNKLPVLLLPSLNYKNNYHQKEEEEAAAAAAEEEKKKKKKEKEGHEYENKQQQQEGVFNGVNRHDYYNPREIWLGLNHKQRHQSTRCFYNILEKKVYDFQLPIPSYLNCRGSSYGWLVVVEESCNGTYPVHLLNPFRSDNNNNKIQLPPLNSSDPYDRVRHSYFLDKVILSADPSSSLILSNPTTTVAADDDELVVLGLSGSGHLRFCRPGDISWTALPESIYKGLNSCIVNITCYKGQFWVILQSGRAMAFDISPLLPEPNVTTIIDPPLDDDPWPYIRYLVESAGSLFQVRRDIYTSDVADDDDEYSYSTAGFYVFKLDWASMKWVKTNSLDGHMFFLGNNASISLPASDYYFSSGGGGSCKPNSIYFTDDHSMGYGSRPGTNGPHDMGVFNLDDGSFERFEPYYTVDSRNIMPAPIWIQPML